MSSRYVWEQSEIAEKTGEVLNNGALILQAVGQLKITINYSANINVNGSKVTLKDPVTSDSFNVNFNPSTYRMDTAGYMYAQAQGGERKPAVGVYKITPKFAIRRTVNSYPASSLLVGASFGDGDSTVYTATQITGYEPGALFAVVSNASQNAYPPHNYPSKSASIWP